MRLLLWAALLVLVPAAASAHLASDSYLRVTVAPDGRVDGQGDVALRDLEVAVGLDADADGDITWGELRAKAREVDAYVLSRLELRGSAGGCVLRPSQPLEADYHAGNGYAVIGFTADCPQSSGTLRLTYRLLFDLDPTHRGLLTIVTPSGVRSAVLSPERAQATLDLAPQSTAQQIANFLRFGFDHILFGYDHLLFVAVLLIAAPLRRVGGGEWQPIARLPTVLLETFKVLTAFTIAHAITLTLAALGLIEVPARLVDPAVALTIMLAAADNVRSFLPAVRWSVAFVFGLIHGMSFAATLGPMQLSVGRLVLALGSFNIGVEAGQGALALLLVPVAFVLRRERIYPRAIAPALSGVAFLMAALWFVDRVFALDLLGLQPGPMLTAR